MRSISCVLGLLLHHARWIELFNVGFACVLLVMGHIWWARTLVVGLLLWQVLLLLRRSTEGLVSSTVALLRSELQERINGCPAHEDNGHSE